MMRFLAETFLSNPKENVDECLNGQPPQNLQYKNFHERIKEKRPKERGDRLVNGHVNENDLHRRTKEF